MNEQLKNDIKYLLGFVGEECWGNTKQELELKMKDVKEMLNNIPENQSQLD